jgi:hypothetical protein
MGLSKCPTLLIFTIATSIGCGSSTSRSVNTTRTSSPDYVTSIEIAATPAANAYELISRLRPRWLQTPPTGSLRTVRSQVIVVYVDGVKLGPKEGLRSISSSAVKTMQYYDAARAATVLHDIGSDPIAGAIVITTTRIQ